MVCHSFLLPRNSLFVAFFITVAEALVKYIAAATLPQTSRKLEIVFDICLSLSYANGIQQRILLKI